MNANRFIVVAGLLLTCAACHRHRVAAPSAAQAVSFSTDSAVDPGAAMLAGIDNARVAIAHGDQLGADNDLAQALSYAEQLPGATSKLFPDQTPTRAGAHRQMLARFPAQVRLQSADAALQSGDVKDADADLAAIQAGVPARLAPANLPLIEAAQSLALARAAVGRTSRRTSSSSSTPPERRSPPTPADPMARRRGRWRPRSARRSAQARDRSRPRN
ncbi:MAG TPA: hypothetical protein VME40_11160 [Caulobacteraceae bacterium]|nr:hypothetical protein [Caulobacteraceae bacterium]